jgi:hypothetical protein
MDKVENIWNIRLLQLRDWKEKEEETWKLLIKRQNLIKVIFSLRRCKIPMSSISILDNLLYFYRKNFYDLSFVITFLHVYIFLLLLTFFFFT